MDALNQFRLDGKVALITGGGTGIGSGIARLFVQAGAQVVITGRTEEVLRKAVGQLGPNAHYYVHDATDLPSIAPLLLRIEQEVGGVDILVNNAGRHLKAEALDTKDDEYDAVLRLNLRAVFAFSREFARRCIARESKGVILMISSMASFVALDGVVAYASSKMGLHGMMLTLTAELSRYGIRVNAVAPGFIESKMMLGVMERFPARKKRVLDRIQLGGWGKPEDVANAALYLCSDAASYVTGVILPVDGGMSQSF